MIMSTNVRMSMSTSENIRISILVQWLVEAWWSAGGCLVVSATVE